MKVRKTRFLQTGGAMPAEQAPAQAPAQGGSPEEQLMAVAQDIILQMGPEAAAMLAQIIMEMLQGGGQPQPQPTFQRKGGTLRRKI